MPVHAAGSRLYRSVPFKHLVKKAGSVAGGRATNISLNLTPFVDMMTILVTFLLMVFSSTGQLLQAQKGLELPIADSHETLQQAPVIIVTKTEITYQGQLVATTESVLRDDSPTFKIDALFERLDAAAKKIKKTSAWASCPRTSPRRARMPSRTSGLSPERSAPTASRSSRRTSRRTHG